MKFRFALTLICAVPAWSAAAEVLPPIDQRFAAENSAETPQFRQHVVPLLSRLGCNGRACHGSFQGQGGFRLSLFGYDFKADHQNLTSGDSPRINLAQPSDSLALKKALMIEEHEGGRRFEANSWAHRVLLNWITSGAQGVTEQTPELVRLRVTPSEITARKIGETFSLTVIAEWTDGVREDVTPLCRFTTNNDEIAAVDARGQVSVLHAGDAHVVVSYDNGVIPVELLLPVSDTLGPAYPKVPTPTKVDELVVAKLRKLGVVPSEVCTDAEFLRRVSLDITGTLPTPMEVEAFLADKSRGKRPAKVDELLERPGYAAWWATKFCDFTGNNARQLNGVGAVGLQGATREWYEWLRVRLEKNTPYDELAEGIVLAVSRRSDESYEEYCQRMSGYYQPDAEKTFSSQDSLTHYWARRNFRKTEDRAMGFAYTFLGVRIQCAQCHKHPFDQWTKDDFDRFTTFFGRVNYGNAPNTKDDAAAIYAKLGLDPKKLNNKEQAKKLSDFMKQGETVPFQELFVIAPPKAQPDKPGKQNDKNEKNKKNRPQLVKGRVAKYLGGEEVKIDDVSDPREFLMDWLRDEDNPYFAKAIVNRIWAGYFHVGIVEPPDDLSLGNPPSNAPLLDHLAQEFRQRGYDMKWLHRTIANSRTYQLSWRTNATNQSDHRHFSHAEPRRLPAEVALDAVHQATASDQLNAKWPVELQSRAIADAGGDGKKGAGYALSVFGRSIRDTNCDCDRSDDASLLQTVYLQNDQELLSAIDRKGGWLDQIVKGAAPSLNEPKSEVESDAGKQKKKKQNRKEAAQQVAKLTQRLQKLEKQKPEDTEQIAKIREHLTSAKERVARLTQESEPEPAPTTAQPPALPEKEIPAIIRQAYLRTLSRNPDESEVQRAQHYFHDTGSLAIGARDLLWALLNTKEFLLNH